MDGKERLESGSGEAVVRTNAMRLILDGAADGPTNMAADELLLDSAANGQLSLRTYRWRPATLSLGYFQPAAERLKTPAWRNLPFVRRSTGGGAIFHDEKEVTYAIALPPAVTQQQGHAEWHCLFHRLMVGMLRERGLEAAVVDGRRPMPGELDFLCFTVPQPGDVVLQGRKIIGGAQRLRGGALLQHGSILPPAAGIIEGELPRALARHFGVPLQESTFTHEERQRIETLVKEKYGSDSWNLKR